VEETKIHKEHSNATLAQRLEQHFCKVKVVGSNPTGGSIFNNAGIVKRSNTGDCKSSGSAFGGSNPSPCTIS
jgi:hypothetical protein